MDGDAVRRKRLEEIETKRKRLEEMRKTRATSGSSDVIATSSSISGQLQKNTGEEMEQKHLKTSTSFETDTLVSSILSSLATPSSSLTMSTVIDGKHGSKHNSAEKSRSFGTLRVGNAIHILPSVPVSYDKCCQTEVEDVNDEEVGSTKFPSQSAHNVENQTPRKTQLRRHGTNILPQSGDIIGNLHSQIPVVTLTDVEKSRIFADPDFSQFLKISSLHVERALEFSCRFDIFRDYSTDSDSKCCSKSVAFEIADGYEEDTLQGRPVMNIVWSHLVPELFLVAYGAKNSNISIVTSRATNLSAPIIGEEDFPGLVCIWSKDMHSRPEMKFSSVSAVLVSLFHPSEPKLIIGGCYNGQIVLWDMKSSKTTPVQRSSLTGKGHKHPVYSMAFSGSSISHELITISIDGQICYWDISRLTDPINVAYISFSGFSRSGTIEYTSHLLSPIADKMALIHPLNVSCLAVSANDGNPFFIAGSGSGQILKAHLPYKPLDPNVDQNNAHFGLVTSLHLHPHQNGKYKHLFLSSSLDWTIKLFSIHDMSEPLFEFLSPTCDYVCDVQWSPVHPALFVTITSTGKVTLWNLSKSTTEPIDTISLFNSDDYGHNHSSKVGVKVSNPIALNKALWSKDGQQILIGDSAGVIHKIKVQSMYAVPSQGEENKFELVLLSPGRILNQKGGMTVEFNGVDQYNLPIEDEEFS